MRLQGTWKKKTAVILATVLMGSSVAASAPSETEAAKKVSLTPKKISVGIGQTKKLKLKNNKKKVKWSIVSGKKRIKLKAKKRTGATVVGKKAGKAKVQANIGKKKYTCTVTVKNINNKSESNKVSNVPVGMSTGASETKAPTETFTSATDYYANNSDLIEIVKVEESDDVLTETKSKSLLESKGFGDSPISYDYSITGNFIGDTEITDGSSDLHPMYQTLYLSKSNEAWAIYVINGSVFANPLSFNLESNLEAQLLFSETETLTSYDNASNQFYVTIPHTSEAILKTVEKIDAATLDGLTIEKICDLSGATVSIAAEENVYVSKAATFSSTDFYSSAPIPSNVRYDNDDPFIMVSLGDSYSSGEGIEDFYGQDKALLDKVKDNDWLAHRSENSWPSLLEVPGIDGTMADYRVPLGSTSTASCRWYFAAASGAKMKHLNKAQEKPYKLLGGLQASPSPTLPPQLDVFKDIKGDVDYVTLTIGGNDVGFSDVIKSCATNSSYLHFNLFEKVENLINDARKKMDTEGSARKAIKTAYEDIRNAAGEQAAIIVAGYPRLLDPRGTGFVISKEEAELVNSGVTYFNNAIEDIVNECRDAEKMNIYFVDVETEFFGHEAYSDSPWINEIKFKPQAQDLNQYKIGSDYSIHPNRCGARAYAKWVNVTIKYIENKKHENESDNPTTAPNNTQKDENDVEALQKIIKEQRELGATVSEDINNSDEYTWENGRLVGIDWGGFNNLVSKGLTGNLNLSDFTALESLNCNLNQLSSLDVTRCTTLTYLNCYNNRLSSLDVTKCTALTELDCSSNYLSSLDVAKCTALAELACSGNYLSSLDITNCTGLKDLTCSVNHLSSLDVTNCTALTSLICYGNQLSSLDVTNCTGLKELYCFGNNLSSLDVTKCTALVELGCDDNQLSSLDVTKCTELTYLDCDDNQLSSLDVTGCTALTYLNCYNNQLSSLEVTGCTVLEELICNNNRLSSLDVTGCTSLESLDCGINKLSNLEVTGCTALTELYCVGNQLTILDLSNCPLLFSDDGYLTYDEGVTIIK